MISALFNAIAASSWGQAGLRYGALALTILLFLLTLRRSGAPASALAASPNASKPRRKPMMSNARCSMPRLAVLAIATSLLTACATGISEPRFATVCPPVMEYSRAFQARAPPTSSICCRMGRQSFRC
jgi:hypothetical protein